MPSLEELVPDPDELTTLLEKWVPEQRWYSGRGQTVRLSVVTVVQIGPGHRAPSALFLSVIVLAQPSDGSAPTMYQVPVVFRELPVEQDGYLGQVEGIDGVWHVYDGPYDFEFTSALLHSIDSQLSALSSKVLSGEQSNTSIVYEIADGQPVICKIFRMINEGDNPDVVLQDGLTKVGCDRVPRSVGYLKGRWIGRDPGETGNAHLAFAQEFLPGVEDAWLTARTAIEQGRDFASDAFELGEATADVHQALARAFPVVTPTPSASQAIIASMSARHMDAERAVPELAPYRSALERLLASAADAQWPALQRIHGDYHLGQVLHSSSRGWVIVDFEGEPLRPMAERNLPDVTLRDLAGMLRSLDYAVGSYQQDHPRTEVRDWSVRAKNAFLDGYTSRSGSDPRTDPLLSVFIVDKALYEAMYEARNRPSWLPIPMAAIKELTTGNPNRE